MCIRDSLYKAVHIGCIMLHKQLQIDTLAGSTLGIIGYKGTAEALHLGKALYAEKAVAKISANTLKFKLSRTCLLYTSRCV